MGSIRTTSVSLLFGLILFFGSFALLWWNEGNNARNIATAAYMNKNAIEIESTQIQDSNNNKLVAVTGEATTNSLLEDVNIKMPKTLVLDRTVEMYQWEETEDDDSNGNKKYDYNKVWSSSIIDSDSFHDKQHNNPAFPIESMSFYADNAKLGAFDLNSEQIQKIQAEKELYDLPQNKKYSIENGKYFSGTNIQEPEIGDILISYSYAPSGTQISLIGKQVSNHINSFSYKKRDNYVQYNGHLNKAGIIQKYEHENRFLTISLRFTGWLLMFIGLKILISPIEIIFGFIPFLGRIAEDISSFIMILLSLMLSLITIAIAWFVYRPLISLILIAISLGIAKIIKDKQQKNPTN